MLKIRP